VKSLVLVATILAQVPYIETLEVRVHSVDVVVTDAQGKPVTGLTHDDFQLFEDGKEQPLSNFSNFSGAAGFSPPSEDGALKPTASPEARPPRRFIFYIDQMSLTQPTRTKLKGELDRLLRTTMVPGDEAMIVRPHEEQKLKAPFSSDQAAVRKALVAAIDGEKWRGTSPSYLEQRHLELSLAGAASMQAHRAGARRYANLVKNRVQQRLGELRAIVNASADLPGRKILVLVTESMPLEPGKEAFQATLGAVGMPAGEGTSAFGDWSMLAGDDDSVDWVNLRPLVDEIARSAATGGTTIYAVQAEYGIGALAPGGDIAGPTGGSDQFMAQASQRRPNSVQLNETMGDFAMVNLRATNTEGTLRTLAETTGGTWHRGGLSFDNLVDAIVTDVTSYYSLGYRATADVDKAHRVEVRVKGRPELKVRARKEVIRKSPEREMTDRVVASLLTPVPAGDMPIRVEYKTVGVSRDKKQKTMWVAARIPLSALTFIPDGDKLKASFSVHYAVSGESSDFVSGVHGTQVVEITPAEFEKAKKEQWTYVIPLNSMNRSRYTVAVGVMDTISRQSGFGKVEITRR
jgi:VWFA-related protein